MHVRTGTALVRGCVSFVAAPTVPAMTREEARCCGAPREDLAVRGRLQASAPAMNVSDRGGLLDGGVVPADLQAEALRATPVTPKSLAFGAGCWISLRSRTLPQIAQAANVADGHRGMVSHWCEVLARGISS